MAPFFPLVFWGGLAAPKGTPPAIIEMLRQNIAAAVANPDVKAKLASTGTTAMSSPTSAAFEAQITQELAWLNDAVKAANLQLN